MSGQLVVYENVWMAQRRGPAIQLQFGWPGIGRLPRLAASGRVATGAAVGALFGATTSYFAVWLAIGVAVGVIGNRIMSRQRLE